MIAPHLRTEPITDDDDATVERAVATANILALVASVVHLTGDPEILRGPIRPRRFVFNEFDGGLTGEEQDELRQCARRAVLAYRDAGSPASPLIDGPVLREMMDWIAAEPVADDYARLFLEEMDLAGADPRRIEVSAPEAVSVLIIGCGMSGILAGVRLAQAGIPFEIIEKNDDAGGTWYENTYPGCRVDVGNHYYCYSFEPNHGFSEHFSRQPELHGYFRDVMRRHGLDARVRWRTEVERAEWNDAAQMWRVTTRDAWASVDVRQRRGIRSLSWIFARYRPWQSADVSVALRPAEQPGPGQTASSTSTVTAPPSTATHLRNDATRSHPSPSISLGSVCDWS